MAGGLLQLVAKGVQDLYLSGDAQITFFKTVYRRHTNFSIESIAQYFSTSANFGETVTCTVSHLGDLINRVFLYVELPPILPFINSDTGSIDKISKFAWVPHLGYALIRDTSIEIGGKNIDKQYGEWLYIWSQLSNRQSEALDKMIGNIPAAKNFSNGKPGFKLYIPLEFWFCKNSGLSLPLVALSSSEIKITVNFRRLEECYRIGPTHSIKITEDIVPFKLGDYIEQTISNNKIYGYVINYDYIDKKLYYIKIKSPTAIKTNFESFPLNDSDADNYLKYRIYNSITGTYCTPQPNSIETIENTNLSIKPHFVNSFLYVDYIYLDNDERNMFIKTNHEYLIEQIQFNQEISVKNQNIKQKLNLNHPCKAHYWIVQMDSLTGPNTINDIFNFTTSPIRNSDSTPIGKNPTRSAKLILNGRDRFSIRNWRYFNYVQPLQHHFRSPEIGINTYSPSINPEDYQPSSTINMSKIDKAEMDIHLRKFATPENTAKIRSYTINYNILRVFLNMGALVFV
ncbi:capsid 4 [Acanthamoeba polyphaga mimivirus]|uniref:Capsid 4 n=3 Tax=Megamimivirinae TaxID=3044648 RepID=A0A2L2DMA2_MIMIV|nr:putative capsid protein 4 [Megavirus chiliensis]AEQ33419.1 major capsid protein 4 [Megavirus chiliensis]AGD92361.1 putative capsid protein 4 [Megavirus lba]AVG46179.1 capsid 4 [Acanthamoeba polyphaga mimivirus]AVG47284.1 capsid 4 protein [Acanthamoeba polyphaga mimivirus]